MILRRITSAFRKQDWFTVAIETLIVVLGVFLGLQVNNWNAAMTDRRLERSYVSRLIDDLGRSRTQITESNEAMLHHTRGAAVVLRSLSACAVAQEDQAEFAFALNGFGKYDLAFLDMTTINEMTATGRSDVIRNVKLRESISRLLQQVDYEQRTDPQIVQRLVPFVNYVRGKVQFNSEQPSDGFSDDVSYDRMLFDMPDICSDPQFRAAVLNGREYEFMVIAWNQHLLALIDALTEDLKAEAKARGWKERP